MKFSPNMGDYTPYAPVRVGNVYAVKGGRGIRDRHMNILMAISEPKEFRGIVCCMLTVDRNGLPVGATTYCLSYLEDQMPMGFVDGLEELTLDIRSL